MLFLGFPVQTIGGIHTMAIFEEFEKKLQANPKSIVFTEGTDARILSAASKLLAAKTL